VYNIRKEIQSSSAKNAESEIQVLAVIHANSLQTSRKHKQVGGLCWHISLLTTHRVDWYISYCPYRPCALLYTFFSGNKSQWTNFTTFLREIYQYLSHYTIYYLTQWSNDSWKTHKITYYVWLKIETLTKSRNQKLNRSNKTSFITDKKNSTCRAYNTDC